MTAGLSVRSTGSARRSMAPRRSGREWRTRPRRSRSRRRSPPRCRPERQHARRAPAAPAARARAGARGGALPAAPAAHRGSTTRRVRTKSRPARHATAAESAASVAARSCRCCSVRHSRSLAWRGRAGAGGTSAWHRWSGSKPSAAVRPSLARARNGQIRSTVARIRAVAAREPLRAEGRLGSVAAAARK